MITQRLNTTRPIAACLLAAVALCALATSADAQTRKPTKKLYCWNDNGHRTCGDTLPPGATDLARTEFSAESGAKSGEVARALTPEELAAAAAAKQQAQAQAAIEAARERRDMAMVESYATEADLRRAYNDRITLLDLSIKASLLGESNLRASLVSQLDQASDSELDGKPVPQATLAAIRTQHTELRRQQRILARQRSDRAALDGELADALERYRALKQPPTTAPAPAQQAPDANGG